VTYCSNAVYGASNDKNICHFDSFLQHIIHGALSSITFNLLDVNGQPSSGKRLIDSNADVLELCDDEATPMSLRKRQLAMTDGKREIHIEHTYKPPLAVVKAPKQTRRDLQVLLSAFLAKELEALKLLLDYQGTNEDYRRILTMSHQVSKDAVVELAAEINSSYSTPI
jgi:hypothetical protein